jgi:tetrahydromethanopterin S-methyltransferase subunit F
VVLDQWQEITFDFENDTFVNWSTITTDPVDRTDLNRVVLQMNSENNFDSVTAYIDDISYGTKPEAVGAYANDDFEGCDGISSWFGDGVTINKALANPVSGGINTSASVLEYVDDGTGQYANIRFDVKPNFDLSENATFKIKVYVPSSSITGTQTNQIALKLQDGSHAQPWTTQTEIIKPVVLDQWQEITFDFENDTFVNWSTITTDPVDRTDLNRVVIQMNSENNFDSVTAYLDDLVYE